MIDELKVNGSCRLAELASEIQISGAWRRISAGMIVDTHERGGVGKERTPQDQRGGCERRRLCSLEGGIALVDGDGCNDALWCIKYGSAGTVAATRAPRGANPFACNVCVEQIRQVCPAYAAIRNNSVAFNDATSHAEFHVTTSGANNHSANQTFIRCTGVGSYGTVIDEFSPADVPNGFNRYPSQHHNGTPLTVGEFVETY